jgi:hypothetical protein
MEPLAFSRGLLEAVPPAEQVRSFDSMHANLLIPLTQAPQAPLRQLQAPHYRQECLHRSQVSLLGLATSLRDGRPPQTCPTSTSMPPSSGLVHKAPEEMRLLEDAINQAPTALLATGVGWAWIGTSISRGSKSGRT